MLFTYDNGICRPLKHWKAQLARARVKLVGIVRVQAWQAALDPCFLVRRYDEGTPRLGIDNHSRPALIVPYHPLIYWMLGLQVPEKNGGDDGTRTRGLAGRCNLLELNGTDSPLLVL